MKVLLFILSLVHGQRKDRVENYFKFVSKIVPSQHNFSLSKISIQPAGSTTE